MNILITLCARGGSRGIPGKNIKPLNGLPLIAYSIKTAFQFRQAKNAHVALSTDSDEIKRVAANCGLSSGYKRPSALAEDKAGKIEAINDLLLFEEKSQAKTYDFIIDLDVTSPLRTVEDLYNAFKILIESPEAYNLFSVSPSSRNPYFNMVELQKDGFVSLVKDGTMFKTRQEAPVVYDMNASFYIYRRKFFSEGLESAITSKTIIYVVPHICFDLDHPNDFIIMETLIKEKLLDFQL